MDRQKEEAEKAKKESGEGGNTEENEQKAQEKNTEDELSEKLEKQQMKGENKGAEGTEGSSTDKAAKESGATGGALGSREGIKRASWGKGKGKKGRKGRRKLANSATAGIVPGCEKNRSGSKGKADSGNGEESPDAAVVDLKGEKVHVIEDVETELKPSKGKEGSPAEKATEEKDKKNKDIKEKLSETDQDKISQILGEANASGKCPFSGAQGGAKVDKGPMSGVTSGFGGLLKGQESVDSTDSFDEKVEKGQALPIGHPPVDFASMTPVGANAQPLPMMDMRMFCPKFADLENKDPDESEDEEDRRYRETFDQYGMPINMDEFLKGFEEFMAKKKALEKKIHVVDSSSDEESD